MAIYFKNLLGIRLQQEEAINLNLLEIPSLANSCLDAPFTEAEIKRAVDDLLAEKAPGPDGLNGLFYRLCWDTIMPDVAAGFQCIYNLTIGPITKLNGACWRS
jgi:hypothetical protein